MRGLLRYFAETEVQNLRGLIREALEQGGDEDAMSPDRKVILDRVHRKLTESVAGRREAPARRRSVYRVWPYAAACIVLLSFGIYGLVRYASPDRLVSRYGGDVQPGTNRATLFFDGGHAVYLSERQQGIVVGEGVTYLDGSDVTEVSRGDRDPSGVYQLSTPKGGTYSVTLSDGTRVWLNAASTLRYPARFSESERVVTLVGEAFFDVARTSKAPFKVVTNGQTVEVLGTAFGISAYPDDQEVKTTLVEGAVRLKANDGEGTVLRPGEQGILKAASIEKQEVNVLTHTAWKDGLIVLKGADVSTVVKQIERWYDVEFVHADRLNASGALALSGELPRGIRLSELLGALEMYIDVTFKIEGRRVFVNK